MGDQYGLKELYREIAHLYEKSSKALGGCTGNLDELLKGYFHLINAQVIHCLENTAVYIKLFEGDNTEIIDACIQNESTHRDDFFSLFFHQNTKQTLFFDFIVNTELVLRTLYARIKMSSIHGANFPDILSFLFEDEDLSTDYTKVLLVIWNIRNTIHYGGLHTKALADEVITYKGKDYKFEFASYPSFLRGRELALIELLIGGIDAVEYLVNHNPAVSNIKHIPHPYMNATKPEK